MTLASRSIKTGITSRADLIDLLAGDQTQGNELLVEAIGFEAVPQVPAPAPPLFDLPASPRTKQTAPSADTSWTQFQPQPATYWHVVAATKKEKPDDEQEGGRADSNRTEPPRPEELLARLAELMSTMPPLEWQPLTTESSVMTRLRKAAAANRSRLEMDLPRAVELLSLGRFLYRLPRRARKVWGHDLLVIEDRSRRLVPYWKDQDLLSEWLYKVYPESGFQYARLQEGHGHPCLLLPYALRNQPLELPPPGTLVLALTDLGSLSHSHEDQHPSELWEQWGHMLRDNGNQALALIPCGCEHVSAKLAALWHLIPWDASQHTAPAAARDRLLRIIAPCVRLEPELLRALRHLLPDARHDPALEAAVWQDPLLESRHSTSAPINPDKRKELLKKFAGEPDELRAAVVRNMQATRRDTASTWIEELISLDSATQQIEFIWAQLDIGKQWIVSLRHHTDDAILRRSAGWFQRLSERLPEMPQLEDDVRRALEEMCAVVPSTEGELVREWQSQQLRWQPGDERRVRVTLSGDRLGFAELADAMPTLRQSFLADIRTVRGDIYLHEASSWNGGCAVDLSPANFWKSGATPAWVHDYGDDKFGLWYTFRVNDVEQRMRWVSPGTFRMGSPQSEEGRYDDEGPQHPVTISRGFWMFDTPCTQALWEAVTGDTPSKFKGPNRPVEQVSWNDVQNFTQNLNSSLPGLDLRLPTEAEWEYACRAGSDDARYGELGAIAWYGGNSDSTTHDVGQKEPNAWGFYDLLGNVYEWCQDNWYRRYEATPVSDPLYETSDGAAFRVIRGGCWISDARYARSACRYRSDPGFRFDSLGFRCLSSPEPSQPSGAAMSVSASKRSGAEPTANSELPRSGAEIFRAEVRKARLADCQSLRIVSHTVSRWELETDREIITIERSRAPSWANQSGRDQYGLWAELAVDEVRQRLRWIPSGRFLMGTPTDEEGRESWELPPREVTLTAGFWMFDSPCTQQLWSAVMQDSPSRFKGPLRPVEQVRWLDCQTFLARLNKQFDDLNLRLPSEAQWEYACRAGMMSARYGELDEIAWYTENSGGETHDVKSKTPNAWGLHDMLGNVWEWCQDHWHQSNETASVTDPLYERDDTNADRVSRGGSWNGSARYVRAAYRYSWRPGERLVSLGFRCLSSPEPSRSSGAAMSVSASKRSGADREQRIAAERRKKSTFGSRPPVDYRK